MGGVLAWVICQREWRACVGNMLAWMLGWRANVDGMLLLLLLLLKCYPEEKNVECLLLKKFSK